MFPGATEAHALPLATTNYEADEDGTLHAVLPSRCVYATGEQTCAMFVDHYRKRKTGPCYPVAVVGCRVHGKRRYTLYAAGHYPYGRVAVVPYSAGGELLWEAGRGGPPWQATLFGAAQDAARGQMWRSEQNWWQRWDARRRRTQGRRLEMGGRLTGVGGGLEEREREQIATRLGVATMTVLSGARRWGRSWQSRGAAIVAVLETLACSATLGDRMGAAGAVSDLWGPPRPRLVARWEQTGKSWLVAASGGSEAAGTGRCRQPSGTGTAGHESARSSRLGQRYGRLMNDSSRPPLPVSATALLRYSVVAEVEALVLRGWPAGAAVRHVAGADRVDLDGRLVRIGVRTLQRWRAAWASGKLAALEPRQRTRTTTSQALSVELVAFLRTEKRCDPRASAPELVRRARERGIVPVDQKIDRTSVWRACRRLGLPTRQRPHKREGDTRRWQYAERMQCVLADGKHFRAGAARLRRVALFFLDDATRYGLQVRVGTAESSELFLRALYQMVMRHGLADLFFLDKGPGFNSHDTKAVVQGGLGALLIHGTTRYPQGHGAIERFNRTAYDQVLRSLDGAADVDPACDALTLRLNHFLERYNDTPHETLGKDITPRQRWEQGRGLRFPTDDADLYRRFVVRAMHKVSNDHVIKADGRLWEAPRGSAASWVEVARHVLDGRLWVQHQGRMIELAEVDPQANATAPRGSGNTPQPTAGKDGDELPATAAGIAYANDLRPLVDPEGGYRDPHDDQHDDQHDQEQHP